MGASFTLLTSPPPLHLLVDAALTWLERLFQVCVCGGVQVWRVGGGALLCPPL